MKLTKFTSLLALGLVLTLAASGCRKHPVGVTQLPGQRLGKPGLEDNAGALAGVNTNSSVNGDTIAANGGIASNSADAHAGWPEDREALASNTVHFDYDSSAVRASEQGNVTAVADYLKSHAANAVRIEGNCDERGTAEYNRALGERRAQALREELVKLGIDAGRIDTISYGFDKPVDTSHTKEGMAKNRRGDFVVLTPPTSSTAAK